MAVDKSLKVKGGLLRRRNVLTREERLTVLEREGRWEAGGSIFGLPKVAVRVRKVRSKKKVQEEEAAIAPDAAAEGAPEEAAEDVSGEASKS